MKGTAKKVLSAALKLPEPERVEVVEGLLADLDGSDEGVDAAWAAEIERRSIATQQKPEVAGHGPSTTSLRRPGLASRFSRTGLSPYRAPRFPLKIFDGPWLDQPITTRILGP